MPDDYSGPYYRVPKDAVGSDSGPWPGKWVEVGFTDDPSDPAEPPPEVMQAFRERPSWASEETQRLPVYRPGRATPEDVPDDRPPPIWRSAEDQAASYGPGGFGIVHWIIVFGSVAGLVAIVSCVGGALGWWPL